MKKKLQIIHADTDDLDNPLAGGQPVRTFEVNKRLAEHYDITVFTATYKNAVNLRKENVHYKRVGCYIKPFGLSPHLSFLAGLGPKIILTPHDLVIEEFMPPVGFSLLPLWTSKPVITIVQWYYFQFWEKKYRMPFSSVMKRIAALGFYKYFIAQTEAMSKEIARYVPDALIETIPCGINKTDFIQNPVYKDFALYIGRMDEYQKGLDMLVEIWKKVSASDRIPLVIAGSGPFQKSLEENFSQAGLSDLITFAGKVKGREKENLLAKCRFLVMPSREETFGITALEAMAASKPGVIYNIDNLNEVMTEKWGEVVTPFDTELFAKKVSTLWNNPDVCRNKGIKGREAARFYLWDNIAKQQDRFYQAVLSANNLGQNRNKEEGI